ncbi:MAG: DUF4099 domain-containing protein [Prevotella sp.]|nr:DUF4099 domain-containing protein [Prevotella sp.]
MSENNLEIKGEKNYDEAIREIREKVSSGAPFDEKEREESFTAINGKITDLRKDLDSLEGDYKKWEERRAALDAKIDGIDNEKVETDLKIKKLREQIRAEKVSLSDSANPLVRRLNSAVDDKKALQEMSDTYKQESKGLLAEGKDRENDIDILKDRMDELEDIKKKINDSIMKFKAEEATKKAREKVRNNTSHERDPFLVLFDSIFMRRRNSKERDKLVDEAKAEENRIIQGIETRSKGEQEDTKGEETVITEEERKEVKDDGSCFSIVVENGDDVQVKILTPQEFLDYTQTDDRRQLMEQVRAEQDLPDGEKKISMFVSHHDSREELLKKLEPVMGSAVAMPQDIGSYATSLTRKTNLIKTVALDARKSERIGGDTLNDYFINGINHTTVARKEQPNMHIQAAITTEDDKKIAMEDIPWKQLKDFGLTRKSLSKENIEALRLYGTTNLITVTGKNKKGEQVSKSFKLYLSKDSKNNIVFNSLKAVPLKSIDKRQTIGDIEFTTADKEMLKKYGQLNHLVPFTQDDGKVKYRLVGLDKDTNKLFSCDPEKIKLPKFIREQCTKAELRKIQMGQPVHLENLKDDAGQKFNGWVVMSPHKNGQLLQLKHIDNDFKAQVRNNNFGERTEELKQDKDAKVMSKQTESNDGPKEETKVSETKTKRKALDFSETETTERKETIKRKI